MYAKQNFRTGNCISRTIDLIPEDSKQDKHRTWKVQDLHVFVVLDLAVFIQGQADQAVCNFWLVEHFGRVFLPHLEDDFCWGI